MSNPDEKKAASAALPDETLERAAGGGSLPTPPNDKRKCASCRQEVALSWILRHNSCSHCGASPFVELNERVKPILL